MYGNTESCCKICKYYELDHTGKFYVCTSAADKGCIVSERCDEDCDECESCSDFKHRGLKANDTVGDPVNHPSHYCQDNSVECIDEMEAVFGIQRTMDFCLLNVWKYRKRAVYKNGEQDIKKSDWYMKKYLELKEKQLNKLQNTIHDALTIC